MSHVTIRKLLAAALGVLAIVGLMLIAGCATPAHAATEIAEVGIDMDVTGNSTVACAGEGCAPGTLGTIQTCAEIAVDTNPGLGFSAGSTLDVDFYVDAVPNNIPNGTNGPSIQGFAAELHYNPVIVDVVGRNTGIGIEYASTGTVPLSFTNDASAAEPDADGLFQMEESDNGPTGESGPGILMRVTLHGVSVGSSVLNVDYAVASSPDPFISDHSGNLNGYVIDNNIPSLIVVGGSCATPTPTPGPDTDADGVPDASDNCPSWANPSQSFPAWPVPANDADCDGFRDTTSAANSAPETYVGTDPALHCAANSGQDNEPSPDAWPVDFNDNRIVNGQDVGKFAPAYNKPVAMGPFGGLPGVRFDFSGNGIINGQDIGRFATFYNRTCA
jgi:hypothetical protein